MLRADSLATLYIARPARRLFGGEGAGRVPILMYHSVSEQVEKRHPYYQTATAPATFRRQMRELRDRGYRAVSVAEALRHIEGNGPASDKLVAITFDDGYRDFYTQAFPTLQEFGHVATMYLPTAYIGAAPQAFKGIDCLTWGEVREMARAGMEFGSHTVTHPLLITLAPADVRKELMDSKDAIEQELGGVVDSFAYPYAFPEADVAFRKMLRETLVEAGYKNGVSTILGTADRSGDRYFQKRLPVNSCDGRDLFGAKLEGAYDWLHGVQYGLKALSARKAALLAARQ